MTVEPDFSFVRENRALGAWLGDLVSLEAGVAARAAEMLDAMRMAVPLPETDLAEFKWPADLTELGERYEAAVREAVDAMGERRAAYVRKLLLMQTAVADDWAERCEQLSIMRSNDGGPEDVALERMLTSGDPVERERAALRFRRLFCLSCAKDQKVTDAALMSRPEWMASVTVLKGLDAALLDGADLLVEMLEVERHRHTALDAIERTGSAGREFIGSLLDLLDDDLGETSWFEGRNALAAVGRGDAGLADALMVRLDAPVAGLRAKVAGILEAVGPDLAGRENAALERLKEMVTSGGGREMALRAAGSIGRDRPDVIAWILPWAEPKPPKLVTAGEGEWTYEEDSVMYERGSAIDALAYSTRSAALTLPALIEAFNSFVEYDCDMGYGGENARVCDALRGLGPDAAPALPVLAAYLERWVSRETDDQDFPGDVFGVLVAIGPAVSTLIPLLEKVANRDGTMVDEAELAEEAAEKSPRSFRGLIRWLTEPGG